MSCAGRLSGRYYLAEKRGRPGGACRTELINGYTVDHTGHYLHFADRKIRDFTLAALRGNWLERARDSRVRLAGREGAYPFQTNLFGHDPRIIRECITGLFGAPVSEKGKAAGNFRDWILRTQGQGIARHFMFPFNSKQFRVPLSSLLPAQGGRFLPKPDKDAIVAGALRRNPAATGYNAKIWYPRSSGIEALPRALAARLRASPVTGVRVRRIWWKARIAELANGTKIRFAQLVNTAPLPELAGMLRPIPPDIARAASRLRWIGVLTVHAALSRPARGRGHWIYCPERRHPFFRYGYPSNINPRLAPRGRGLISAEMSYLPGRRPAAGKAVASAKKGLAGIGAVRSSRDLKPLFLADLPVAYVLVDKEYSAARRHVLRFLARNSMLSIGRYGGWNYGCMEDAIREGRRAGDLISAYGPRSGLKYHAEIP